MRVMLILAAALLFREEPFGSKPGVVLALPELTLAKELDPARLDNQELLKPAPSSCKFLICPETRASPDSYREKRPERVATARPTASILKINNGLTWDAPKNF